ncbi:MAG: glycosyltransferase family 1 protein [bacterium]
MAHDKTKPAIGIDARFYGPIGKGLGRYTERLINSLEKLNSDFRFFVFLKRENWFEYQPKNKLFTKVLAPYQWYSVSEQTKFLAHLLKYGLDLVHFAHFNVPLLYRRKFITTIHDLILTEFPTERATTLGAFRYKIKHYASQLVLRNAAKKSAKIVTVSDYSAQEISQRLKVPLSKISVIYEGSDLSPSFDDAKAPNLKAGLPQDYVLYVGNVYPHKNVEKLLLAWKKLKDRGRTESLILVGRMDYFYKRVRSLASELDLDRLPAQVIFPGFVNDRELLWLYKNAKMYVFPSLMEGFGLPALEAMQAGVPVVSAKSSCLTEILGEAAHYFDPHNPDNMAQEMSKVLDSDDLRQSLINKGHKQADKYQWDKTAQKTLELYQELL